MGVKRFVWDEVSDNVLLETDETDTVTARYCQRPERFGELLFQDRSGTKSFYHYDVNASTCNLTDSSEAVTDTTLYTACGEKVISSGSTTNPFGYKGAVGYYTNEATSDIYVRNRSYEPAIGRWLSKDPLGFVDGTSLYRAYFVPNGIDPTGSCSCCCCPGDINLEWVGLFEIPDWRLPENSRYGLFFRVIATLLRTENRIEGENDCKIEWYECSSTGGDLGQKPNEWFRVPGTPPDNAHSDWFDEYTGGCPGRYERYWEDNPSIFNQTGSRTRVKFAVRVTGAPDCTCQPSEVKKFFILDVSVTKGGGILNPPTINPDPPVFIPGLGGDPNQCTEENIPWEDPWK